MQALAEPGGPREVIGQILDYAKELAAWDYDRLSRAVGSAADEAEIPCTTLPPNKTRISIKRLSSTT